MNGQPVDIVVPAKNEAAAIGRTLRALPLNTLRAEGFDPRVLVLDGHSQDSTAGIARRMGATVLLDPGEGKGSALRSALHKLRDGFVVMVDADGSYAADAIPNLLHAMQRHEADIAMGDRQPQAGSMTATNRVGNALLSLEATLLYGTHCPDVCTGLWGFRTDALRRLPLESKGFELEAELFSLSARLGLSIVHVPVDYMPRDGETKLAPGRDGLRIGWCLFRSRFRQLTSDPTADAPEMVRHEKVVA